MLAEIDRETFLADHFEWNPGEHVVIVSPTGGGKSWLMWQLLERAMEQHPDIRPVWLLPKPSDETATAWARNLGLKETPSWPPRKPFLGSEPPGYVLWPKHATNVTPEERHALISSELRKGMDAQFWTPRTITVGDDAHSLASSAMYNLNGPIEEHLVNGRSNKSAIWLATQRPSGSIVGGGLTSFAWPSASHLFLGKTPADADVQKYSEIGGIDPRLIQASVRNLRTYKIGKDNVTEWLYVSKAGPYAALIGP